MMKEVEVITLGDIDYVIIDTIKDYAYLAKEEDLNSICIRRIEEEGGEKFYTGLSSETEFNKALLEFTKKHKDFLENNGILTNE